MWQRVCDWELDKGGYIFEMDLELRFHAKLCCEEVVGWVKGMMHRNGEFAGLGRRHQWLSVLLQ